MEVQSIIDNIVEKVAQVSGVAAVVLGGSRAKETHTSKSDIDIGIYYESEKTFDLDSLQKVATDLDDSHREQLITKIGEWGPWINGGGWLTVSGYPVDFLFRDINKVSNVVDQCLTGKITIDYYPGHPHGFINAIYMAEVALCKTQSDPKGILTTLKTKTSPYPPRLKNAIIEKFLWEASFSLVFAGKSVIRKDASHAAGCCFRSISCLNQALFAFNEAYWMNETGAVDIANKFSVAPANYKDRINEVFSFISSETEHLERAINLLQEIVQETEDLVQI
jgi:predicted nucleotidyltransferase